MAPQSQTYIPAGVTANELDENEQALQIINAVTILDCSTRGSKVRRLTAGKPFDLLLRQDLLKEVPLKELLSIWGLQDFFDDQHTAFFEQMKNARYGVGLFSGPPGVANTTTVITFLSLFLDHHEGHGLRTIYPKWKRCRLLFSAHTNFSVNNNARQCQDTCDKYYKDHPKVVIRLRQYESDDNALHHQSNFNRANTGLGSRGLTQYFDAEEEKALDSLLGAAKLWNFFQVKIKRKNRQVVEKRLQHIHLSLGFRMMQKAGIEDQLTGFTEFDKFADVRFYYKRYKAGQLRGKDLKTKEFTAALRVLRCRTLETCDVVCCTVVAAAQVELADKLKPDIIFVDDAARVMEQSLYPILVKYTFEGLILVGDNLQLPRTSLIRPKKNSSSNQTPHSLFSRLKEHHFEKTVPFIQYRALPKVHAIVQFLFRDYAHTMNTTEFDPKQVALGNMIERINRDQLGDDLATPTVFLDIRGGFSTRAPGSTSAQNKLNHKFGMWLIDTLLSSNIPARKIVVLTPYRDQCQLYHKAMRRHVFSGPAKNHATIQCCSIDAFQGSDSDIVILDLVNTQHMEFLNRERLVTATSRARTALYVIGDVSAIEDFSGDHYFEGMALADLVKVMESHTVIKREADLPSGWLVDTSRDEYYSSSDDYTPQQSPSVSESEEEKAGDSDDGEPAAFPEPKPKPNASTMPVAAPDRASNGNQRTLDLLREIEVMLVRGCRPNEVRERVVEMQQELTASGNEPEKKPPSPSWTVFHDALTSPTKLDVSGASPLDGEDSSGPYMDDGLEGAEEGEASRGW